MLLKEQQVPSVFVANMCTFIFRNRILQNTAVIPENKQKLEHKGRTSNTSRMEKETC